MSDTGRGRPTGTVSFLFTDIEGSTRLWEEHGGVMRAALERHDAILRAAIAAHEGVVFSTAGDAFSAAFWSPAGAVRAALDGQRALQREPWPPGAPLKVRMGLHVGEAHERDGDYFGPALNRTARLMSLAHGGQVLASLAFEELARDGLDPAANLVPLGVHELRGLARPETVFELRAAGLASGFAPLRAPAGRAGNLPRPPTSFVGRVDDVKRVAALAGERRLVTLVGPGGVGKTRLAIEAAAALAEDHPGGVWFVDLAPLAEPAAVAHAAAAVLGIAAEPGSETQDAVVDALAGRPNLLVLDNCEHVVGAAARLAAAIGRGAPNATVLATSREPLGVAGEQLWPVAPLDPALEAVDLFVERARAADPAFELSDDSRQQLAELCARLDGIPLAVELAAARVRALSISDLAARMGDRFGLLRAGRRRDAAVGLSEARQQTLLATVEWSYRLLEADEQRFFDRLSVFAGSFDAAAGAAVCDEPDAIDLLEALVERSMVQAERPRGDVRFRLLETLRHYGRERLGERGEAAELADRHLAHYSAVADQAAAWFEGTRFAEGRAAFEQEWDNLRAALDHAEARHDGRRANRLVAAPFWYAYTALVHEHERWTRRRHAALATPDASVLACAATWARFAGDDPDRQVELGRQAVAAAPSPDHPDAAFGWWSVCCGAWYGGRPEEARAADVAAKALAARGAADFPHLFFLGYAHPTAAFAPEEAPAVVARARDAARLLGNDGLDAILAPHAGIAEWANGRRREALAEWRRAAALGAAAGMPNVEAAALGFLTIRAAAAGEADPGGLFHDTLTRLRELRIVSYQHWALAGLADWWACGGRLDDAARILGYLDRADPTGNASVADLRAHAAQVVDAAADAPRWRAEGGALSRDQLIGRCLERLSAG